MASLNENVNKNENIKKNENIQKNENLREVENVEIIQPTVTTNDPSFNTRYQPNTLPNTDENMSKNLKEKLQEKSTALSDSIDFSMGPLLKQALQSLENFMNPRLSLEQKIPNQILKEAKGIMFLSVVKGGIGIGGMLGTGIIMARNPNWRVEWTAPCAIAIGGLQIGFNIGFEKIDHIIIIRDENVINKFHNGIRLGGDISLSVGPLGRDVNVGLTVNEKGIIPNVSYSMAKGAYMGFAFEGSVITIRNECNEQFFGQKCDVSQILNGSIKAPFNEDYDMLCKTLSNHFSDNSWNTTFPQQTNVKDENHPILNVTSNTKTC